MELLDQKMAPKSSPKKRAAAKSPAGKRGPAKKAKVEDLFTGICDAAFNLMDEEAAFITKEAKAMFRASVPFALQPAKADRHKFQDTMVTTISAVFEQVNTNRQCGVDMAKSKVADADAEAKSNAELLVTLEATEKQKLESKEGSDKALKEAEETISAKKASLEDAKKALEETEAEHAKLTTDKAEREKLIAENWAQLKDGTYPGKQWREKNKSIEKVVAVLKDNEVEASCSEALPVALKEKVDQRGDITVKCINYVDMQLGKSLEELSAKIAGHAGEVTEKTKAVEDANTLLKEAMDTKEQKVNEAVEAENALLTASEEHKRAKEQCAEIAEKCAQVKKVCEEAEASHVEVKAVLSRFEAVVEGGEAGAAAAPNADVEMTSGEVISAPPPAEAEPEQ